MKDSGGAQKENRAENRKDSSVLVREDLQDGWVLAGRGFEGRRIPRRWGVWIREGFNQMSRGKNGG